MINFIVNYVIHISDKYFAVFCYFVPSWNTIVIINNIITHRYYLINVKCCGFY